MHPYDRHRTRWAATAAAACVIAVVAVAFSVRWLEGRGGHPSAAPADSPSWHLWGPGVGWAGPVEAYEPAGNGRGLTVRYTGSVSPERCREREPVVVTETDRHVVVGVPEGADARSCAGSDVGVEREAALALAAPLGSRLVLDAFSGQPVAPGGGYWHPARVVQATLDADGQTLELVARATRGCSPGPAQAWQDLASRDAPAAPVQVVVQVWRPQQDSGQACQPELTARLRLVRPLDQARVVDGQTGSEVAVRR